MQTAHKSSEPGFKTRALYCKLREVTPNLLTDFYFNPFFHLFSFSGFFCFLLFKGFDPLTSTDASSLNDSI